MNVIRNLTWNQCMQLAGLGAIAGLIASKSMSVDQGLPFLAAIFGLAINTSEPTRQP